MRRFRILHSTIHKQPLPFSRTFFAKPNFIFRLKTKRDNRSTKCRLHIQKHIKLIIFKNIHKFHTPFQPLFYRKEPVHAFIPESSPFLFSPQSTLISFAANDVEYAAPQQVHGKHHPQQINAKYKVI